MVGWSMSAKRNDEHTHKCDDLTEEYLVWKQEMVRKPEVIYVSYLFILVVLCSFVDWGWRLVTGSKPSVVDDAYNLRQQTSQSLLNYLFVTNLTDK